MLQRFIPVVLAMLVVLALPVAASSSAQETRPHRAACIGFPDDPLSPHVRVLGICHATHLGRDSFEASHLVSPAGPPDANLVVPIAITGGRAIHVAASGDRLYSTYAGTGTVSLLTGRIEFELVGTFTGGSGRFADASGSSRLVGAVEDDVARFSEEGALTY